MKKRFVFFCFLLLFFSFLILSYADFSLAACTTDEDCPEGQACQDGKCIEARVLEITYPVIPGIPTPKYVTTGLPEYVNYIFRFAVILIGFLIFGALIYNGANYLLSLGNPQKLSEARKGIFTAFLGGIILLSAYLIFNTINPQLVILEPAEITTVEPVIIPGVYLCNYNIENIESILEDYQKVDAETRIKAVKELKEKMGKPGDENVCFRINSSGNLKNVRIKKGSTKHTLFIVPREEIKYEGGIKKSEWKFEYGIVLHENDKFGGQCKLLPAIRFDPGSTTQGYIYDQIEFHPKLDFTASSITLFQKPTDLPSEEAEGVILYEGLRYNEIGAEEEEEGGACTNDTDCPEGQVCKDKKCVRIQPLSLAKGAFKPSHPELTVRRVDYETLKEYKLINKDGFPVTKSIKIDPKGFYFGSLFESKDFGKSGGKCQLKIKDDANLGDDPIGRCGSCGIWEFLKPWKWGQPKICYPCTQSMIAVSGQTL